MIPSSHQRRCIRLACVLLATLVPVCTETVASAIDPPPSGDGVQRVQYAEAEHAAAAPAADTDTVVIDLPLAGSDVQRVWYRQPAQPVAALVLFTGGDGVLKIDRSGVIRQPGNFLVRTRDQWIAHGFAVAIPDVPSDRSNLMQGRLSRSYGEVIRRIVELAHSRSGAPVWLVGTSLGSLAAGAGAGRLTAGEIAGVVLTSSVSLPGRPYTDTVFGADLGLVTVPALVVSNKGDRCLFTPPSDAERIRRALSRSPKTEVMLFEGGLPPKSTECEAFAEHGYYGIEAKVVDGISAWIIAQTAR